MTVKQPSTERIEALDVLRGIAILGIMLLNIQGMGSVPGVGTDPRIAGWDAIDRAYWWVQQLFLEGTMRGLLSLLFGAGFVILAARPPRAGLSALSVYYRRMAVLIALGLVHTYLLMWPGDILVVYGIAGLLLFPLRAFPARALFGLGLGGIAMLTAIGASAVVEAVNTRAHAEAAVAAGADEEDARIAAWEEYRAATAPDFESDARSRDARQGGLVDNLSYKFDIAAEANTPTMLSWWVLDALAMMLVGASLYKMGFLGGQLAARTYVLSALAGYAIGLPINFWESWQLISADFAVAVPISEVTYQIGRLATTLGHAALALALLKTLAGRRFLGVFRAPGRMALTCYIAETLIAQWLLFPGFALGLHGTVSIAECGVIAFALAALLIVFSTWWLRRYRMGPLEWLWRWLTYGQRPAFRTG